MTIFGTEIESNTATSGQPSQWNRTTGGGSYIIEQFEAAVTAKIGSPYSLTAHRVYSFLEDSIFLNTHTFDVQNDIDAGRIMAYSHKQTSGTTWAQVGAATSGSIYTNIVNRGNQFAQVLSANPNLDIWWSFFHEPNGNETTSGTSGSTNSATGINNWHAALQNIWTIWTTICGVPVYAGLQDGTVTSHGMLLAGPNLAGPAQYSSTGSTGMSAADHLLWYGTPDGAGGTVARPWFWQNVQMVPIDTYPGSDGGGAVYRVFPEDFLGGTAGTGFPDGLADWLPARIVAQNALGRVCYPSLWEFGFLERDALDTVSGSPSFNTNSPRWSISGLAPTRPNLFALAADYLVQPNWGGYPFHSVLYWDDMKSPNGSRGPWPPDTTLASWNAYVDFIVEIEGGTVTPPPSVSAGVGAILG